MYWIFWLIAVILSVAAGYWVYKTDKKRAIPMPWLTALLRGLVIFSAMLLLLLPHLTITNNETQKPIILLLQDNSTSISTALGADSIIYKKNILELTNKLSDKYKVVQWGFGNSIQPDSIFHYTKKSTNIAAALSKAQEFYGTQNLGAIILATDGRFNNGANPLYQDLSLHSPLYTIAIGDSSLQKDIRVTAAYANKTVSLNSHFEIRADVLASLCNGYNNNVELQEAGSNIATTPLSVNSDHYDRSVSFTIKASKPGLHHYVISIPVADGEKNTANNRKDVFVNITDEKKNILIVSAAPHPDVNAIKQALSGLENYKVTVKTADEFPPSLNDYQVIILHGLPAITNNMMPQLQAIKKPIWYILSNKENTVQLNQLQKMVTLDPLYPHDVFASFSSTFGLFILPQNIQAVLDKMPPLSTSAGNIRATPDASVLFTQKDKTPLWLMRQGGTPVAMLLGEGIWRWRLYEYKNFGNHNVIDECIRQTVIFLASENNDKPFRVVLPKYVWSDQEPVTLNAYLLNANNEQINTPDAQLTITDSADHKQNFSFERSGDGYALNIGVWAGGTYTYSAHINYEGKPYIATGSYVVESTPLEQMETGADYPLLYGLAKKYNGALFPAKNMTALYDSIILNNNIKPIIQTNTETLPLVDRKWFFFLILLIAVAEWLLRKYWLAQ